MIIFHLKRQAVSVVEAHTTMRNHAKQAFPQKEQTT